MYVTIIADASRCAKTGASGYGFWIASQRAKFGGGGSFRQPTSSVEVAESLAICNAISIAISREAIKRQDSVLIQTDCVNAIDILSGKRKTLREDESVAFNFLRNVSEANALVISFRHVKGHSNLKGARYTTNRLCDQRAKVGMRKARQVLSSPESSTLTEESSA
jgi:ribonuclease HI